METDKQAIKDKISEKRTELAERTTQGTTKEETDRRQAEITDLEDELEQTEE